MRSLKIAIYNFIISRIPAASYINAKGWYEVNASTACADDETGEYITQYVETFHPWIGKPIVVVEYV